MSVFRIKVFALVFMILDLVLTQEGMKYICDIKDQTDITIVSHALIYFIIINREKMLLCVSILRKQCKEWHSKLKWMNIQLFQ